MFNKFRVLAGFLWLITGEFMMQVSPQDAVSNLSKWWDLLHLPHLPVWAHSSVVNKWGSLIVFIVFIFIIWPIIFNLRTYLLIEEIKGKALLIDKKITPKKLYNWIKNIVDRLNNKFGYENNNHDIQVGINTLRSQMAILDSYNNSDHNWQYKEKIQTCLFAIWLIRKEIK
jgi:hypothetical protein